MRSGLFDVLPWSERAILGGGGRQGEYRLVPLSARDGGDRGPRRSASDFSITVASNDTAIELAPSDAEAKKELKKKLQASVVAPKAAAVVSAANSTALTPARDDKAPAANNTAVTPPRDDASPSAAGRESADRSQSRGPLQDDLLLGSPPPRNISQERAPYREAAARTGVSRDDALSPAADAAPTPPQRAREARVQDSPAAGSSCNTESTPLLGQDAEPKGAQKLDLRCDDPKAVTAEFEAPPSAARVQPESLQFGVRRSSMSLNPQPQSGEPQTQSRKGSKVQPQTDPGSAIDPKVKGFAAVAIVFIIINVTLGVIVRPTFKNPKTDEVQTWQPYMVLNGVIASIILLAIGVPADLLLLGLSSAFCTVQVITTDELLGGLANEGVVAVAALCAVSASIDKTKALNGIMGKALGMPNGTAMGIIRMALPLITLGSVFNNTPLVAVFIPIVKGWTAKAGLNVGHFMMPLSFFAMLSATLTTMGSSTNLLAVKLVPEANINFLDPAPVGLVVIVTGVVYCVLMAPCMLPDAPTPQQDSGDQKGGKNASKDGDLEASADIQRRDRYTVHYKLSPSGPLLGQTAKASGLLSALPSPVSICCTVGDGSKEMEAGERIEVSQATADEVMTMAMIPGLQLQAFMAWYKPPPRANSPASRSGASLWKRAKKVQTAMSFVRAGSSASLGRSQSEQGMSLDEHFQTGITNVGRLAMPVRRWVAAGMGGGWDDPRAVLCKLIVPPGGPPNIETVADSPQQQGVAEIVVSMEALHRYLGAFKCTLVSICGVLPYDHEEGPRIRLRGGEIFLVEAMSSTIKDDLKQAFAIVFIVDETGPPDSVITSPLDPWRPLLAVAGLLITVVVSALDIAPLDAVAILVALCSLLNGTLTSRDFYRSINGPVLLTVAASFGAGAAIYNTGLATCLATGVLFVAEPLGPSAIMAALVGLALSLGIFVSNNTVVILLAPLIRDICERKGLSLKMAMLGVIYAANLSFATPFSYQTNMMVMPHGHYVFMDYVKFGVPMMIICGIVALIGTLLYWG